MRSSLLMERFCSTIPTSQHTNDDHLPAKCRRRPARRLRPIPCHPHTCPCPVLILMDQYGSGTAGAGKLRHLLRLTFAATARSTPPRPATGLLKPTHPTGLRRFPATKGGGSGKARYHLAWARFRHNSRPPACPLAGINPPRPAAGFLRIHASNRLTQIPRIGAARRQRRGMASLRGDGVMDACPL